MAYKHVFPEFLFYQRKKGRKKKTHTQNYLLPEDPSKQRFVIHTPPPNPEIMIHTEIRKGRTHIAPSEQNAAILT